MELTIANSVSVIETSPASGKIVRKRRRGSDKLDHLRNEFAILTLLKDLDVAPRPLSFEETGDTSHIDLEFLPGQTLASHLETRSNRDLLSNIKLCIAMAQSLLKLHDKNIVHLDLSTQNILVQEREENQFEIRMIDFEFSSLWSPLKASRQLEKLNCTPAYMSPELCSRLRKPPDFRSDIYSFGIIIYEIIAGSPPFLGDLGELVYLHTTKSLPEVKIDLLPEFVELMKIAAAKDPESRYQTTRSLLDDLISLLALYKLRLRGENSGPLNLRETDQDPFLPLKPRIIDPMNFLDQAEVTLAACKDGISTVVQYCASPGISTESAISYLVQKLNSRSIACFLVRSKLNSASDFSDIIDALFSEIAECFRDRVSSNANDLNEMIRNGFTGNTSILCRYFPSLRVLFGNVPDALEVNYLALQNALVTNVELFLKYAASNFPFAVFIENWNSIDDASRRFLTPLVEKKISHISIFIAETTDLSNESPSNEFCHSNNSEAHGSADLAIAFDKWHEPYLESYLQPYNLDATIGQEAIRILLEKTNGSPLAIQDMILNAYTKGTLSFDQVDLKWQLDCVRLAEEMFARNVIERIIRNLSDLDEVQKSILSAVLIAPNGVSLQMLHQLTAIDHKTISQAVSFLLLNGTIKKSKPIHLELQQDTDSDACLFTPSSSEIFEYVTQSDHWKETTAAARLARAKQLMNESASAAILDLAMQLSSLEDLTSELGFEFPASAEVTISIYQQAAEDLHEKAAFQHARFWLKKMQRIQKGQSLWLQSSPTDHQIVSYAMSDYLAKDFSGATEWLSNFGTTSIELLSEAAAIKMDIAMIKDQSSAMIEIGENALAAIAKLTVKEEISEAVATNLVDLGRQIILRPTTFLKSNKLNSSNYFEMKLLAKLVPPTFQTDKEKYKEVVKKLAIALMKGEWNAFSPYAMVNTAVVLLNWHREFELAKTIGIKAIELLEYFNVPWFEPTVRYVYAFGVSPIIMPLQKSPELFQKAALSGHALGDHVRAYFSEMLGFLYEYFSGAELKSFRLKLEGRIPLLMKSPLAAFEALGTELLRHIDWLIDGRLRTSLGSVDLKSHEWCDQIIKETSVRYFTCAFNILRFEKAILSGNFEHAYEAIRAAQTDASSAKGMHLGFRLKFYFLMICEIQDPKLSGSELRVNSDAIQEFKDYATAAPDLYIHFVEIVEATRCMTSENPTWAPAHRAILWAKRTGSMNDAVLMSLLLAFLLKDRAEVGFAFWSFWETEELCRSWGAEKLKDTAKEVRLGLKAPIEVADRYGINHQRTEATKSSGQSRLIDHENLDLDRLIKATQAISSLLEVEVLLKKILNLMFESAGADSGSICSVEGEKVLLLCCRNSKAEQTVLFDEGILLSDSAAFLKAGIVESVVREVSKSSRACVFCETDSRFSVTRLRQFAALGQRTALYLPIVLSSDESSFELVVLSHSSLVGIFDNASTRFLEVLATQAAISLRNARLVEVSKEKLAIESELNTARAVQDALFPESFDSRLLDIARAYRPAGKVGGDWHAIFRTPDEECALIFCGDVTGHGVSSALVTGVAAGAVYASIVSQVLDNDSKCKSDPQAVIKECLVRLNAAIWATGKRVGRNMTIVGLALIRQNENCWKIIGCNAGHCNPLLICDEGGNRSLRANGDPIGYNPNIEPLFFSDQLTQGESLIIYTDGLTENSWPKGEKKLNTRKLVKLCSQPFENSKSVIYCIEDSLGFQDPNLLLEDDCTIIAVRINQTTLTSS